MDHPSHHPMSHPFRTKKSDPGNDLRTKLLPTQGCLRLALTSCSETSRLCSKKRDQEHHLQLCIHPCERASFVRCPPWSWPDRCPVPFGNTRLFRLPELVRQCRLLTSFGAGCSGAGSSSPFTNLRRTGETAHKVRLPGSGLRSSGRCFSQLLQISIGPPTSTNTFRGRFGSRSA